MKTDLSFHCVAVPRCAEKRLCAGFANCPSRDNAAPNDAPTPTDEELFAAYWKDQARTNFYSHGPAQIAQGLRNVYVFALTAYWKYQHEELLNALSWHVNHEGECLGDHPELLEAARILLAKHGR